MTPTPPHDIDPLTLPYGIAPVAAAPRPRRRRRRRRLVDAAIASSTLAALPLAGLVSRTEPARAGEDAPGAPPTLVAAVDLVDAGRVAEVRAAVVEEGVVPATAPPAGPEPAPPAPPAPDHPTPIAAVGGVELVVPSMATVLVGFHEASKPGTETMTSLAPLDADHTTRPVAVTDDPVEAQVAPVVALPSRARPQSATSAIDIAIPEGEEVLAPVSGRVVMASPYALYGRYQDWRLEIEPDGHPGTRVILIHVDDVRVAVGDRVEAGRSVLAGTANLFPFESQIDRFVTAEGGAPTPHVHVEVKRVR